MASGAEPELPTQFDVVVVGTGLSESIFAGACARAGKSVLHLDNNAHYGARSASFTLKDFGLWLRGNLLDAEHEQRLERVEPPARETMAASGVDEKHVLVTHVPDTPCRVVLIGRPTEEESCTRDWSILPADSAPPDELIPRGSRFNIDITPQLIRCGGPMVDALRSSGVAAYLEFKPIALHAYHEGGNKSFESPLADSLVRRVPCTKGDIFKSSTISLIEKRQLMKFLQSCAAMQGTLEPEIVLPPQALAAPDAPPTPPPAIGSTFSEFCESSRLSPALRDMATYALIHYPGPVTSTAGGASQALKVPSARDGIRDVCRHIRSLGKFGSTAYLAPLYGTSELPQAFCRLCAVWGGTYMLTRGACAVRICSGKVIAVADASGRWVNCEWALLNPDNVLEVQDDCGARNPDSAPAASGKGDAASAARKADPAASPSGALPTLPAHQTEVARCIVVLDESVLGEKGEELAFISLLPGPETGDTPVFVIQQDGSSGVCPQGFVLLHLSCEAPVGTDPHERLQGSLSLLLRERRRQIEAQGGTAVEEAAREHQEDASSTSNDTAEDAGSGADSAQQSPPGRLPKVVWGAFFSLPLRRCDVESELGTAPVSEDNLFLLEDSRLEPTCDNAVSRARRLFERVCPNMPFLPPRSEEEEAETAY